MTSDLSEAHYAVLDYLYDELQRGHDVMPWDTTPAGNQPGDQRIHEALIATGFMVPYGPIRRSGMANLVKLTPAGDAFMNQTRRLRADKVKRSWACRDRLLAWYASRSRHLFSDPEEFVGSSDAYFHGDPFTVDEVKNAGAYLARQGLLREAGNLGGRTFLLDDRGQGLLDEGGLLAVHNARQRAIGGTTVNVHGDGSQVNTGDHVQQTQTHTRDEVAPGFEDIAKAMAMLLRELPNMPGSPENRQIVVDSANDVLAEVQTEQPRPGFIRRCLAAVHFALLSMAAGPLEGMGVNAVHSAIELVKNLQIPG